MPLFPCHVYYWLSKKFVTICLIIIINLNNNSKQKSRIILNKIHNNLKHSGIDLSKADLIIKINKIIFNLNAIKKYLKD